MSKELQIINQQEVLGKEFKVYGTIEQPLFLAKDVAEWIEHSNSTMMLNALDDDEKIVTTLPTKHSLVGLQSNTQYTFITEDGLYEVLMQSRKPIAKEFKKEVKKILKQLRLTGASFVNGREEEAINNYFPSFSEDVKLAMVQDLRKQNELLKAKIEEQQPLIEFANTVADSSDTIDMGEMAKLLNKENIKIGRNRLFDFLKEQKVLMLNNNPYQKYIENKWFEIIEVTKNTPYGTKLFNKTLVTGKGQIGICELVKKNYSK